MDDNDLLLNVHKLSREDPINQVEKYSPDPAEKYQKSKEHGSSIPVNGSGEWMYAVLIETDSRIRSPDFFVEFLKFPECLRPESACFLEAVAENSCNTASKIIDSRQYDRKTSIGFI